MRRECQIPDSNGKNFTTFAEALISVNLIEKISLNLKVATFYGFTITNTLPFSMKFAFFRNFSVLL